MSTTCVNVVPCAGNTSTKGVLQAGGDPLICLERPREIVLKHAASAHMAQLVNMMMMWAASESGVPAGTHRASGW